MQTLAGLICDMDGTLVDSVYLVQRGLYEAAQKYLASHGVPKSEIPSYEDSRGLVEWAIGGTARESLERLVKLLDAEAPHHLEGVDYEALNALLDPIQNDLAPKYARAYPGLPDLLMKLGRAGWSFAVVTSATRHQLVRNLGVAVPEAGCERLYLEVGLSEAEKVGRLERAVEERFGLRQVAMVTCELVSASKPDPAGVLEGGRLLGLPMERCVVAGDHPVDMRAAVGAGAVVRVGMTHGFGGPKELKAAGATMLASSLAELAAVIGLGKNMEVHGGKG